MPASLTGTAANFEDLVTSIVDFLTTDATLTGSSENWQIVRNRRDNLLVASSNATENLTYGRGIVRSCRQDPRSSNAENPSSAYGSISGIVDGSTFIQFQLKAPKPVASVSITASLNSNAIFENFRLQRSDDGVNWTTELTVSDDPTYSSGETILHELPAETSSHSYWRILIDSSTSSSTLYWESILLISASGERVNHYGSEVILKAPGSGGGSPLYVGLRSEYSEASDWYNLVLNGYTGFLESASFFGQPGALPGYETSSNDNLQCACPMVPAWNNAIPYWFSANGRAFKFGIKVSTSYESGYLGFMLPYATPSQYPYPLVVAGSLMYADDQGTDWRYSINDGRHSCLIVPAKDSTASLTELQNHATLYYRSPEGTWRSVGQRSNSSSDPSNLSNMTAESGPSAAVFPTAYHSTNATQNGLPYRNLINDGYVLSPIIIAQRLPDKAVIGEIEGFYAISGFNNAAENTTIVDSVNHIILQNVARTETHEYFAMALD